MSINGAIANNQIRVLDWSGLLTSVPVSKIGDYKIDFADNDAFAKTDFEMKLGVITNADIQFSMALPGKAGSVLLASDAANASRAQDILFGKGNDLTAANGNRKSNVVPFVQPETSEPSDLAQAFGKSAARYHLGADFRMASAALRADNKNTFERTFEAA